MTVPALPALHGLRHRGHALARNWAPIVGLVLASVLVIGLRGGGTAHAASSGASGKRASASALETPDRYKIFVMNQDGSGQRRLTTNLFEEYGPAWSPDGAKIAFGGFKGRISDVPWQIFVINVDGSGQTRLTNTTTEINSDPDWSPDGTKIAFTRGIPPIEDNKDEIFVMNADGSAQTNLTDRSSGIVAEGPDWSPDGTKIAFSSPCGPVGVGIQVCVMNADGSGRAMLTGPDNISQSPDWSPEGTRIAFSGPGPNNSFDILVMNADGSGKTKLTNSKVAEFDPAWSPDGTKIAFDAYSPTFGYQIFVMNADGSGTARLTNDPKHNNFWPAWSPDGTKIAFTRHFICRVPRVVGRTLRVARRAIVGANCSVGRTRYKRSAHGRGRVLHQDPPAGMRLEGGARVGLFVSRGRM